MKQILVCFAVFFAAMALVCTGCSGSSTPGNTDTEVAFTDLTANGTATETTTTLTLTFDKDITDLAAGDITFTAGSTGAVKGTLTRTGTGIYELAVSGITADGQVTVAVNKSGYAISPANRSVTVTYYYDSNAIAVTFSSLTANGSATETTTALTLTFDKDIAGLAAADITLNAGSTGAVKGGLTKVSGSTGVYELAVSGTIADGQVTVAVSKSGYTISPSSRNVTVFYYNDPNAIAVAFSNLTANGSATETTTALTLTFDKDIAGLAAGDITLNIGSTGTVKGGLTKQVGTGVYELAVSGISSGGEVTVAVSKSGYAISPSSRNVTVNYYNDPNAIAVAFSNLTANGSTTETTTVLTLTFDKDITGLAAGDITLNIGSTGTVKGGLTKQVGTGVYELAVSGISSGGEVTVAVSKSGYTISPSSKNVTVFYYVVPGTNDPNAGIGIGDASVKLYLNNSSVPLGGGSTQIEQGSGTYTVSIDSGSYSEITWYLNGNIVSQGTTATSILLSKQREGIYLVTVEAIPIGGEKNSGSHNFVVQSN